MSTESPVVPPITDSTSSASDPAAPAVTELSMLKERARLMGVSFSNNISLETLKERIEEKMSGKKSDPEPPEAPAIPAMSATTQTKKQTLRQRVIEENMKLIRLRITNLDPKKKDLHGEIFTVANEYLGTVRKFVPFGEVTENGYHVPYCIYKMMKSRKFLNIRTFKVRGTSQIRIESSWAQEFALDILDPLTRDEINKLAAAQSASGNI